MRADRSGDARPRVGVRCDAGPTLGVGHLVRCVGLAEEMRARGWEVVFLADVGGLSFAERLLGTRGLRVVPPPRETADYLETVERESLDAVVLDSYTLPAEVSHALVAQDVAVLALVDGPLLGQRAHLYVDQNAGAEHICVDLPSGTRRLAGTRYAILRDDVRARRPDGPWRPPSAVHAPMDVVVAFGGTDAFGVTGQAVHALSASRLPLRVTVVAPDEHVRGEVVAMSTDHVNITARAPFDEYPGLLASADLVVGAAGTSVWEYCCLGRAAAVTAVADNQEDTYAHLVSLGAVVGLGHLKDVSTDPAGWGARLRTSIENRAVLSAVAAQAFALVDGRGRVRVVDGLATLVDG
ncbi:MAG: spore coat protein [Actinomycetota bacterium]|nr:spore coat protein [Actinomycetota bacterium]